MVTINGRPDTEDIARTIVIKILNESLVKYHGSGLNNDETKALTGYVKGELEEIIKYSESRKEKTTAMEDCEDELYTMFYECTACGSTDIIKGFKYCPMCGREIEQILSPAETQEMKEDRERERKQEAEKNKQWKKEQSEKRLKGRFALQEEHRIKEEYVDPERNTPWAFEQMEKYR